MLTETERQAIESKMARLRNVYWTSKGAKLSALRKQLEELQRQLDEN